MAVPVSQTRRARVPQLMIVTELNAPQTLSCQSPGQPVGSCVWGHHLNGSSQPVIIDEEAVRNGGGTPVEGVSFLPEIMTIFVAATVLSKFQT